MGETSRSGVACFLSGIGTFDFQTLDDMTIGKDGNFGNVTIRTVIPCFAAGTGTKGFGHFESVLFLLSVVVLAVVVLVVLRLFGVAAFLATIISDIQITDTRRRRFLLFIFFFIFLFSSSSFLWC